jgi:hypothetical protein
VERKEVIIAVIKNFLFDLVRNLQESNPGLIDCAINSTIGDFMEVIHKTATRLPRLRFALAQHIINCQETASLCGKQLK